MIKILVVIYQLNFRFAVAAPDYYFIILEKYFSLSNMKRT